MEIYSDRIEFELKIANLPDTYELNKPNVDDDEPEYRHIIYITENDEHPIQYIKGKNSIRWILPLPAIAYNRGRTINTDAISLRSFDIYRGAEDETGGYYVKSVKLNKKTATINPETGVVTPIKEGNVKFTATA